MKITRKKIRHLSRDYLVSSGAKFHLRDFDTAPGGDSKFTAHADELLLESIKSMSDMQEKLYAQENWSVLLIFQAMDAAGKDGTIKHVMSGVNPQGCQVTSFKQPSPLELSHDYLWRSSVALPERGRIGIFNRSYYEEVLVVRVHEKLLQAERIPAGSSTKICGRIATRTSTPTNVTSPATAPSSANSSSISPRANRKSGSSPGSTNRQKTGNSPRPISRNAPTGTTTSAPTRK